MRVVLIATFFIYSVSIFANSKAKDEVAPFIDSLVAIQDSISLNVNDSADLAYNTKFASILKRAIAQKGSFKYDFAKVDRLSVIQSSDKKVRIYNWMTKDRNAQYTYHAFVQYYLKKKKEYVITQLADKSSEIVDPQFQELTPEKWYGALYYEIVPQMDKNQKYYMLLGWDGNNWMTKKKIIEPISFDKKGNIKFGLPIFRHPDATTVTNTVGSSNKKGRKLRVIFEHSSKVSMTLSFNEELNMIVFDHLAPNDKRWIGVYQFYVPDFSFDGYAYRNRKWYFGRDVDAKNFESIKKQVYNPGDTLKPVEFEKN